MLYERNQLPELYYMKHRHDSDNDTYVKYDENILESTMSPYMFVNSMVRTFLVKLQPLVSLLFDHMNVINNFKNYIVSKYYYKH